MIFDKDRTILVNKNTSDSLTTKALSLHIFVFLGTVATIAIIGVSYYFLTTLQESMLRDKKHEVKNMVDTAYSLILHFQNLAKSGKLKEEDAKIQAINTLRQIRFDNSNYFWINDSTIPYPVMLMHPAIPSLENRVMNDKQFNCAVAIQYGDSGKYIKLENKPSIFTAFAKVCNSNGSGFVEYRWPKPTKDASITAMYYPKISYVKKVNDWNWIVGSGIYIDDVEASYSTIATRIESIVGVIILLYLVLTVMIATRLFRYEKDIIKARDETNTMFNISKDGIALLDLESNFLDCNNAYLEMTGFTKKELLETSCIALSIPEDMEKAKAVMLKVAEIGFVKNFEKTCIIKDGKRITINMAISLMPDKRRVLISTKDITEKKELENKLIETNEHLQELVESEISKRLEQERLLLQQSKMAMMGEMIGAIAHQWRQPLNALGLIIQDAHLAFKLKDFNEENIDAFKNDTMSTIQNMSHTIDDFRNFFKPEKEKQEFVIETAVQHAVYIISPILRSKGIKLHYNPISEHNYFGYKNELQQVLLILISNAQDALLNSTVQKPSIEINIKDLANDTIELSIHDNAGGVPMEIIDRIFEPYFTTKHQTQGTGIGLYMAKEIIERQMGGRLRMENIDGGAMFTIEI